MHGWLSEESRAFLDSEGNPIATHARGTQTSSLEGTDFASHAKKGGIP